MWLLTKQFLAGDTDQSQPQVAIAPNAAMGETRPVTRDGYTREPEHRSQPSQGRHAGGHDTLDAHTNEIQGPQPRAQ